MRYKFTLPDESVPWANTEVPIVGPLNMPMDGLSEVLRVLKWKLADLHALLQRAMLAAFEQRAQRRGVEYSGEPSNLTGEDEILMNQLTVFATLRTAGYPITWGQACTVPLNGFHAVPDGPADEALLTEHEDDEDDPQEPSTDSAPVVAGEAASTSEPTGPQ